MSTTSLTSKQRAAAVLISLGSDVSSKVYKHLREDEIEQITYEISKLDHLSSNELEKAQKEFYEMCLTEKVVAEGGIGYAKNILEKAFGEKDARKLLEKVRDSKKPKPFRFLERAENKAIVSVIKNEHPQIIALILSYIDSEKASKIIARLPKRDQADIVIRIANLENNNESTVNTIERVIRKRLQTYTSADSEEVGGVNRAADLMNYMDRGSEQHIFNEMGKKNSGVSEEIRKRMFVFDDILKLDSVSIQRFIREVDSKDLVLAIKGSNAEMTELFLNNMSTRMAERIESELEYAQNIRKRDIEKAQQSIVNKIRKLERDGQIIINRDTGDDDFD